MTVARNWRERAAGADDSATFGPEEEIVRRRLASLGRIGEWKDHRLQHARGHHANYGFRESVRLSGRPDQHRRMRVGDHLGQSDPIGGWKLPGGDAIAVLCERRLKRLEPGHAFDQQAVAVDEIEPAAGFLLGKAGIDHGAKQKGTDAGARRARSEDRDTLFGERHAGDVDRAQDGAHGDGGGALNIVVVTTEPVPILRQQPVRIAERKIFPMQQHMRPSRPHGIHERRDEIIVGGVADALMPPADVERIGEKLAVVGSDIEEDR